jgi:hypothetical protein
LTDRLSFYDGSFRVETLAAGEWHLMHLLSAHEASCLLEHHFTARLMEKCDCPIKLESSIARDTVWIDGMNYDGPTPLEALAAAVIAEGERK